MNGNKVLEMLKNLVLKVQSLSRTQAIIAATAAVVAVGGAGTGGYFLYEGSHQPQETVAEAIPETEETEASEAMTEDEIVIAEILLETENTETAEVEQRVLSLVGSSMEKDLKIKVQDQNSKLVTGAPFVVTVAADKNGAKTTTYEDKDKDGIIYISDIAAGNYRVVLEEIEGYEIKTGTITVAVKDKLEYKKVDVSDEIKSESEVNTAVEDTAVNNVPVESTLTDTVPLLDSTVTATKVTMDQVSKANFTPASASGSQGQTFTLAVPTPPSTETPSTETPNTETPSTETPSTETQNSETPPNTEQQSPETISSEASVQRNSVRRVASETNTLSVSVSLPTKVTMYKRGGSASTTCTVTPVITGDSGIITEIWWDDADQETRFAASRGDNHSVTFTCSPDVSGSADFYLNVKYRTDNESGTDTKRFRVTVEITEMTDTSTVLKDASGNVLYADEKATRQATLYDYGHAVSGTVFYTSPKYTGWQTRDGKVYYYDANHNAVTGNQVIGGVMYTFSSDGSLAQSSGSRGIDVSKWQGSIDWGAVAASGINFAIIRVGYRGATTGALIEDPYFKANIAGATRAGIKVGVYFFTQAVNEIEAVEEASMVLKLISGYRVTYPVFIDTERATNGRANGLDRNTRTAVVSAFCRTIANGGYKPGVYASKSWYNNQLNASSLNSYCIWVAQYNSSCTYSGKYDIWQYTSTGKVPGISGNVDMNIGYTGY